MKTIYDIYITSEDETTEDYQIKTAAYDDNEIGKGNRIVLWHVMAENAEDAFKISVERGFVLNEIETFEFILDRDLREKIGQGSVDAHLYIESLWAIQNKYQNC